MKIVLTIPMLAFLSLLACDEPAQLPTCDELVDYLEVACMRGCQDLSRACNTECVTEDGTLTMEPRMCSVMCMEADCEAACVAVPFEPEMYGYCEA